MDYLRTVLIFAHLLLFAFAITRLYTADALLLFKRPCTAEVKRMGDQMVPLLAGLWLTGLGVVWVDTGFAWDEIMARHKLLAKFVCVAVLTLNSLLIHLVAFRKLAQPTLTTGDMLVMSFTGAISTSSWTFAGFLGVAQPMVKHLTFTDFVSLYGLVLTVAVAAAAALTPVIARNWSRQETSAEPRLAG